MLQDIDLKYVSGTLTTTRNLTLSGSGTNLAVGGSASVSQGLYSNAVEVSNPQPGDLGMKAWAYDPASISVGQNLTDGTIYLSALYIRKSTTVTGLVYFEWNAATTPTAGQSWIGLYNSAGTKLIDAALDSAVTSIGVKNIAVTQQTLTPGLYWVALLFNGTGTGTDAQGGACNGTGGTQIFSGQGLSSGATLRFAVNGTAATTLPSSITPGSNTTTGAKPYWVGVA
ncbi:hypothetical protein [Streptomyces acidiscabies]|uniref:Uncharacterized protein n=1 Tax=Streptomyces acidiscabies TaxID=42234 RepID=A0A0L0KJP1_9ACTN|nr:hypothetical protein [Streptomyces acidiscabies]KND38477.1 hypothetical protein IQ63_07530 [Streptomyces acidiscabies]